MSHAVACPNGAAEHSRGVRGLGDGIQNMRVIRLEASGGQNKYHVSDYDPNGPSTTLSPQKALVSNMMSMSGKSLCPWSRDREMSEARTAHQTKSS